MAVYLDERFANIDQDRGNIGNARVLGMQKDLGLSNQQFLNIIMMFCKPASVLSIARLEN